MTSPPARLMEMRGISKSFPGVRALKNVSLELNRGEVLALVGENGAGKSTLMKILGGIHDPDRGEILIDGKPTSIESISHAKALGIALIHQELMLAPNLTVAGNVFLGEEVTRRGGVVDRRAMNKAALALLRRVGLDVPPARPLRQLTTGQMQMVEIAKALAANARILIMDEPTSSLTAADAERLFEIMEELRKSGIAIIYISHRLEEVRRVSDRITVLRDGERVADLTTASATHDAIVSAMVGREFSSWFPSRHGEPGEKLFEAHGLRVPGSSTEVSFDVRRSEILGFAGLVGSGRTELMRVIFGVDRPLGGSMSLARIPYRPRSPADAIARGVYLAPEDRKLHGLVVDMNIAQNVSLPDIGNYEPRGWLQRGTERRVAREQIERLGIRTPSWKQRVVNLSGGNQQKVVLAKWLAMRPAMLILDEPTRGIDVGAKAEIYRHMVALADAGIAIVMVSSEMEEVIGMSDRVVVMHERRITAVLDREDLSEEGIMQHMTGKESAA